MISVFLRAFELTIERNGLVDGDQIRFIVNHPTWQNPLSTRILTINGGTLEDLLEDIARWVEYREVPLTELEITTESFCVPHGRGRLTVTTMQSVKSKKSVITIKNDDSTCLARAIVTAMANFNKDKWTKTQIQDGFNRSRKLQKDEALWLHEESGVPINEFGSTLDDVKTFAEHLGIQINTVDADYFNEIIFWTEPQGQMIYLYKNKNHFDVITSMPGFLCKDYYCHTCKKSYKTRDKHKCPSK